MEDYKLELISLKYIDKIKKFKEELESVNSSMDGAGNLKHFSDMEKYVLDCKLYESKDTCPPHMSISYEYLCIYKNNVVGMINLRPEANNHPMLKEYGGHIGYCVSPLYRRMGVASFMLEEVKQICRDNYHLDKILITCLKDNEASRRTIIKCGGLYEKDVYFAPANANLERYWIKL